MAFAQFNSCFVVYWNSVKTFCIFFHVISCNSNFSQKPFFYFAIIHLHTIPFLIPQHILLSFPHSCIFHLRCIGKWLGYNYSFLINLSKSFLHLGHKSYVLSRNSYLRTFLISRHISLSSKAGTMSPQRPTCLNLTLFQLLGIISFSHLSQVCHSL